MRKLYAFLFTAFVLLVSAANKASAQNYIFTTSAGNSIDPGTTLVPGSQGDDQTALIALPFPYTAYGTVYNSVNACTNGNLQFTTTNTTFANACPLPSAAMGVSFFPHWDDLHTGRVPATQGIFTSISGVAPNRIFNIEWRGELFTGTGNTVNFEARLFEGQQRVDFIYGTVTNNGVSASIGVQSQPVLQTTFSCNTASLSSGLGVSFVLGSNDNCSFATTINCPQTITGTTVGATPDAVAACNFVTLSTAPGLWYTFVGTGTANTLSLCGSGFDTEIGVFTGTCGALVCVTANDDFCGVQSQVTLPTTTLGTTYYVLVTGFGLASGAFTLARTCVNPIPNDDCTGAVNINCGQTITGTTVGATTDAVAACAGVTLSGAPGLWYSFVGNGANNTLSLCGSGYDTEIGVFTGTCATLVCVTANDDFCGLQSQVTFATTLGTTYYILVTGFGTASGAFTLNRTSAGLPNDVCTGAININCGQTITGSTVCGATPDAVGTCITALGTANGLWYTFVGDGSPVTLSLCGSSYDTKIGIFRGTCAALVCVTGNDDFCGLQSQVTFTPNAAVTYYVLVTGFGTANGNFTLTRTCAPPCAGVPSPGAITPATSTACVGASVTLTCSGYSASSALTFQWSSAPAAAGPYTLIAGATSNVYTFAAPATTTYYRCTVTCTNGGGNGTTAAVVVNVSNIQFTSAVATPSTVCSPGAVTITGTVTGGLNLGNYTYTLTGPGTIGAAVPSGTNNSSVSFSVTNIPFGNQVYTLTATDPVPCSKSTTINVTVNPTPLITIVPAAPVICAGAIQPLTAIVSIPGQDYVITTSTGNAIDPGTTLVPGSQADDATSLVTIPFTYTAYGIPYTTVRVGTNGNLQFTTANTTFANVCPLPAATMGVAFHPHWDDLNLNPPAGTLGIYTSTSGVAPNRIFNIEWRAVRFGGTLPVSFEARLFEGLQRVDYIYGAVDGNGLSASIGVQSQPTAQATTFSCNTGGLSSGLGISFAPPSPAVTFTPLTELYTDAGATAAYTGTAVSTIYAKPSVTRTYTASYTTPQNCTNTANVTVTVNQLPAITVQPTPATQTVCPGVSVNYSVVATGAGPLTYQWRRNAVNLVDGVQISGATTTTLTISNVAVANAGTYDVVVSGICPPPAISNGVVLNVASAPTLTAPANATICSIPASPTVLLNNTTVVFSVTATGTPPPTIFQWQVSTNAGVTWTNLANSTLATASPFYSGVFTNALTISNAPVSLNNNQYRLVVTNSCGQTTNSAPAILTVNTSPVVAATDLFNQRICLSDTLIPLAGTPVGGAWTGIGVSGFNFVPTVTAVGSYTLTYTYTNAAGCTVSDTTLAKVLDCPERLRELTDEGAVLIYPNPSNGHFFVKLKSTLYNYLGIKTYDISGHLMVGKAVTNPATNRETLVTPTYTGLVYGRATPVDLSHLANGTYLLVVYYDDGVRTSKKGFLIVIQR